MHAIVITVGSELTSGRVIDANTAWLAGELRSMGLRVQQAITVADDAGSIAGALECSLRTQPVIIVMTGGLGPTSDDLTAAAIARFLGVETAFDPEAARMVSEATGRSELPQHLTKQATLPTGCTPLRPAGSAPGFIVSAGGPDGQAIPVVVLPGVPSEMKQMWREVKEHPLVRPVFPQAGGLHTRTVCLYGIGEPEVGEAVDGIVAGSGLTLEVSICARYGEITIDITGQQEDKDLIDDMMSKLRTSLKDNVYSDGEPVEAVVAALLVGRGATLAVAESCTGGMLGKVITSLSGASDFFRGGVISYDNDVKENLLGVSAGDLTREGAVSEPVARQMAAGARSAAGADYGIGITGIAGPTGGTPEKPVGLVFIAVSSRDAGEVRSFNFRGGRSDIRRAAVTAGLHMLRALL